MVSIIKKYRNVEHVRSIAILGPRELSVIEKCIMERFDCEMARFPPKVRLAVTKIHAKCKATSFPGSLIFPGNEVECKVLRARDNILLLLKKLCKHTKC